MRGPGTEGGTGSGATADPAVAEDSGVDPVKAEDPADPTDALSAAVKCATGDPRGMCVSVGGEDASAEDPMRRSPTDAGDPSWWAPGDAEDPVWLRVTVGERAPAAEDPGNPGLINFRPLGAGDEAGAEPLACARHGVAGRRGDRGEDASSACS